MDASKGFGMNAVIILVLLLIISIVLAWYFTMNGKEKFQEVKFTADETNRKIAEFEKNQKECSNQSVSNEIYSYVVSNDSKRPFGR
jgi:hypothetical protein